MTELNWKPNKKPYLSTSLSAMCTMTTNHKTLQEMSKLCLKDIIFVSAPACFVFFCQLINGKWY